MPQDKNRVPPHSIESEQACLGAILIDPGYAVNEVMETVSADDFYHSGHQIIYRTMQELANDNNPIDSLTVTERLKQKNVLDSIGGVSYIAALTNFVPTSANVKYYASIVREKSQLRKLMDTASQIYEMAGNSEDSNAQDLIDNAEKMVFEIAEKRSTSGNLSDIKSILKHTIEIIEARVKNKGVYTGIPSGFKDLDNMTYGFQNSDLIILAARPSMGKTALALNMACNMSMRFNKSLLFFSLEMSKDQLMQRILASESYIDSNKIRSGYLEPSDFSKLLGTAGKLNGAKMWVEDAPGMSYMDIRATARRVKAKYGLDMIIIDYLQLIQLPYSKKEENRQNTVAEVSRNLKMIARELKIPVIALAQVSRAVEQRTGNKEPMLSDLRESGAIEQDADLVAFIHRPFYYDKENEEKKAIAEIIIAKQRNGPIGKVNLSFIDKYTKFEDYSRVEANDQNN